MSPHHTRNTGAVAIQSIVPIQSAICLMRARSRITTTENCCRSDLVGADCAAASSASSSESGTGLLGVAARHPPIEQRRDPVRHLDARQVDAEPRAQQRLAVCSSRSHASSPPHCWSCVRTLAGMSLTAQGCAVDRPRRPSCPRPTQRIAPRSKPFCSAGACRRRTPRPPPTSCPGPICTAWTATACR